MESRTFKNHPFVCRLSRARFHNIQLIRMEYKHKRAKQNQLCPQKEMGIDKWCLLVDQPGFIDH